MDFNEEASAKMNFLDFTPREYQVEILEKAIRDNVIVFLPTGSGKTFIAIMLIRNYIYVTNKKYSDGGYRVYFLVNTTPLVKQQAEAIRNLLPLNVGEYSGELGVDSWSKNTWEQEQDKYQVLVMTTQIYLDMILHGFTKLEQACLLIFDECHHAVSNHPMRQVMQEVKKVTPENMPKIFGLTATLLNANVNPGMIKTEVEKLESTFNARVVRALNEEMVLQYSTCPHEDVIYYKENEPPEFSIIIKNFIDEMVQIFTRVDLSDLVPMPSEHPLGATLMNDLDCKSLKRVKRALDDIMKISTELGLYGTDISFLSVAVLIERFRIGAPDVLFRILSSVLTGIHYLRKKLTHLVPGGNLQNDPLYLATDKVLVLAKVLNNFPDQSRALIFVDRRSTAQALHQIFVALGSKPEYRNIKSDFIVGVNQIADSVSRENLLNRRKNNAIMKMFNSGDLNVLFASNVIEEGVDIRACNLVVKFDMPKTFRSYIQSKGRARNETSKFLVIAAEPKLNEISYCHNHRQFQEVEETLKQVLCPNKRNSHHAELNDSDDDSHEFVTAEGTRVTGLSAISLLNRYCSMLPSDKFTKLTLFWWVKEIKIKDKTNYIGLVQLPSNSLVRKVIEGIPRESKISAKRLVALKVCKELYEQGELNAHLLPTGRKTDLLFDPCIFSKWDSESLNDKGSNAKKKKKLFFDKHYTKWECGGKLLANEDIFMHIIKISPNYPYPETNRLQAFFNLLLSDDTFCILTNCSWPEIPTFPLFMNVGEVRIEILPNYCILQLSKEEIKKLEQFHKLLFTDALPLLKKYTVPNCSTSDIDVYIISPVISDNGQFTIDWSTIQNEDKFPKSPPMQIEKRLSGPVTEERYHMKVVIPWYRPAILNMKYIVTKVRCDQNPESEFPSQNCKTYADYFSKNYCQQIYDKSQPLLEVRAMSSKINCLAPRSPAGSKKSKKEDDGFEETLVPELCYLLTFPSTYLLKITLIPSIFHRIHHLLLAEELRQVIIDEAQLGSMQLSYGAKWNELKVKGSLNSQEEPMSSPDLVDVPTTSIQSQDFEEPLPWGIDELEPDDIYRNLNVNVLQVLYFNSFVNKTVNVESPNRKVINYEYPRIVHKEVPPLKLFTENYSDYGPQIVDILTALTCTSSNDIINYERYELLGDSFLKFATSLALFTKYPQLNEGKLTQVKGKIIGNKNLFFCGKACNLPGFLKVNSFDYIDWKVPGFSLMPEFNSFAENSAICSDIFRQLTFKEIEEPCKEFSDVFLKKVFTEAQQKLENSSHEENIDCDSSSDESTSCSKIPHISCKNEYIMKHVIPEKVVADSVEALLGVYVQSFGVQGGFKLLKWLSVLPESLCDINNLLFSRPESPLISPGKDYSTLLPKVEDLESSLGYKFKDRAFLLQALTHSSHPHNMTDCYQRFEFLGDAILDFVLTGYIFEKCEEMDPGQLTDLRSALVNNVTFACIAVRHKFHTHLLNRACNLTDSIGNFVRHQKNKKHEVGPQVFYLIQESDTNVAECVDVPKVLGDLFESLIAAVYLDSGKDLQCVWSIIYNIMENEINTFLKDVPKNPIRVMYEKFSAIPPKFGETSVKENLVIIPLQVIHKEKQKIFHGIGENKYSAKVAAAKLAVRYFED